MSRWTISFDASINVSVEADGSDDAVEKAEKVLKTFGIDKRNFGGLITCSLGKVFLIKDEETNIEIRK